MLYMFVSTWNPETSDDMMKKYMTWGDWAPKGMKHISMWIDVWGHRAFRLCEIPDTTDPKVMLASTMPFGSLCEIEAYQVIDAKEIIGIFTEAMKLVPEK